MFKPLISLLIILLPVSAYATVDFLAVNHITKEYYWEEEGSIGTGWIGWEYVPEGQIETAEEDFIKLGYRKADFPYKIESAIFLITGTTLLGFMVRGKRSKL